MAKTVLVLRPTKEVSTAALAAVERFKKISGLDVQIYRQNINQAADAIETGQIDVIINASLMERSEANVFIGCLEKAKLKPIVIAMPENADLISEHLTEDKLCRAKNDFTAEFIFSCLRNILTPKNYRLDNRYFKSILTSVIEVVQRNSQLKLSPSQMIETKTEESQESMSAVICFYGDGIFGSISIQSTPELLRKLGEAILYMPAEEIDKDLMLDLLSELSNQTIGVMRQELKDFGWSLKSSLQFSLAGDKVWMKDTAPGSAFKIPFTLDGQKFDLIFRYSTYQVSVQEMQVAMENQPKQVFDVRLLNLAMDTLKASLAQSFGLEPMRVGFRQAQHKPQEIQSHFIFHAGGWQGEVSFALEMSMDTAHQLHLKIQKNQDQTSDESKLRLFSQIIVQIGNEFTLKARALGYIFEPIYSGSTFCQIPFTKVMKCPGHSIRIPFTIGPHTLNFYFSLRSEYASSLFDSWPMITAMKGFQDQAS